MKCISPGGELPTTLTPDDWQSNGSNKQNSNLFDNCYILGECKESIYSHRPFFAFSLFNIFDSLLQVNVRLVGLDHRLIQ